ncbi:MAG TPA: 50S ribosomal protein L19 [Bacteroidetes bacterium]|nr:50S ribosomal protein L19 [Bacteroidota bacterium]
MSDLILQELARREAQNGAVIPEFSPGDMVSVHVRVIEGSKERIQIFRGTVIGRKGKGPTGSFTVRKVSNGIGVERVFPLSSPSVAKVEVHRKGDVRRGKLYYLRDRVGKAARIREKTEAPKGSK